MSCKSHITTWNCHLTSHRASLLNLHVLVQVHPRITGLGQQGTPGGLVLARQKLSSLYAHIWCCHREIINDIEPIAEGTALTQI